MKRLTILRGESTDQGTFGAGTMGDRLWAFLELPWRDNKPDISCVPPGVYLAQKIVSPHFGRDVYVLRDVPGRSAIEIHPANWGGDTAKGYHSDLRGCAAPGKQRGLLTPPGSPWTQQAVLQSHHALDEILEETEGEDIEVEFKWAADHH